MLVYRPQLWRKWPIILERPLDGDPGDPSLCPGPARKEVAVWISSEKALVSSRAPTLDSVVLAVHCMDLFPVLWRWESIYNNHLI